MKKCAALYLVTLFCIMSCSGDRDGCPVSYPTIPVPVVYEEYQGADGFPVSDGVRIVSDERIGEGNATLLAESIGRHCGSVPEVITRHSYLGEPHSILFCYNHEIADEGFRMEVSRDYVRIEASDASGAFYASQYLQQSLDLQKCRHPEWPAVLVYDEPEFHYRGAMLDVSRHFFTVEEVKEFIDMMAVHRLNRFHWHLTDDQGWRIEIKSCPELTRIGAWRGEGENIEGGFYTQDEIREVVEYAFERCIEVIPEIDMPGHSSSALASYPELGCTGGPYKVAMKPGGVHKDVMCTASEDVYAFIGKVLGEVAGLFPSEYIHIGGDEVPRDRWKACPRCQALIKKENISASGKYSPEDILQYRFNEKVREIAAGFGKKIIGWDEIASEFTSDEVMIMSWRGIGKGVAAMKRGNDVVLSPVGYTYFNNYQTSDIESEPSSTNGIVTMEAAFGFPLPETAAGCEGRLRGVETCLWSSHLQDWTSVEYQMLPRMAAFSEVAWRGKSRGDFSGFLSRLPGMLSLYEKCGWEYAHHFYSIESVSSVSAEEKCLKVSLSAPCGAEIRYTLDGSRPDRNSALYNGALSISENTRLRAVSRTEGGLESELFSLDFNMVKSTFADVVLNTMPEERYRGHGAATLTDGVYSSPFCTSGLWLGYKDNPCDVTIDLGEVMEMDSLSFSSLVDMGSYIMGVRKAEVSVSSDGENFRIVSEQLYDGPDDMEKRVEKNVLMLGGVSARYVRVLLTGFEMLPQWHTGAGSCPFLFIDEIEVD